MLRLSLCYGLTPCKLWLARIGKRLFEPQQRVYDV
jgi:hypothetical protein